MVSAKLLREAEVGREHALHEPTDDRAASCWSLPQRAMNVAGVLATALAFLLD